MKLSLFLQARMNSKRLPGKVLMPLQGKPMLALIASRLKETNYVEDVIVSTSKDKEDDALESFCSDNNFICSRVSNIDNIVERLQKAFEATKSNFLVRLWGDSPLVCPDLVIEAFEKMIRENLDYISTGYKKSTYPAGLDFEIYTKPLVTRLSLEAKDPFYQEFPLDLVRKMDNIKCGSLEYCENVSHFELCVDYQEDFEVIQEFLNTFPEYKDSLSTENLISQLKKNSTLFYKNEGLKRNIEYKEALKQRSK